MRCEVFGIGYCVLIMARKWEIMFWGSCGSVLWRNLKNIRESVGSVDGGVRPQFWP